LKLIRDLRVALRSPGRFHVDRVLEFSTRISSREPFDPANIFFCTLFTLLALAGLRKAFRERRDMAIFYALILGTFPIIFYLTHPDLAIGIRSTLKLSSWGVRNRVAPVLYQRREPKRALAGSLACLMAERMPYGGD